MRQSTGVPGRIEDAQVGGFLAYASLLGTAFSTGPCTCRRIEPTCRINAQRGIPEWAPFATKLRVARQLLASAFADVVPAPWVIGNEVYGGGDSWQ